MANNKVINIATGKWENCTIGEGCRRHAHKPLMIDPQRIEEIAARFEDLYVPDIDTEYSNGNDFGGILKVYAIKVAKTGTEESLVAITSRLSGTAIGLEKGESTFVELPKEDAKFMDNDKLTHALGYAIFKNDFTAESNITLTYSLYGSNAESNIYKVNRLS